MQAAPTWKKIIAFIIDFFGSFLIFGFAIGYLTGNAHEASFNLNGLPAILLFVLIIIYFVAMNRWAKGTVAKHLLGIPPKKKTK